MRRHVTPAATSCTASLRSHAHQLSRSAHRYHIKHCDMRTEHAEDQLPALSHQEHRATKVTSIVIGHGRTRTDDSRRSRCAPCVYSSEPLQRSHPPKLPCGRRGLTQTLRLSRPARLAVSTRRQRARIGSDSVSSELTTEIGHPLSTPGS